VEGDARDAEARAFIEAVARAALHRGIPLVRLEQGGRRLEERFAIATGFIEEDNS
jgi:hypothetical protein